MTAGESERGAAAPLDRRGLLRGMIAGMAGLWAGVLGLPLLRYVLYPVGTHVVVSGDEPLDVIGVDELAEGGTPVRVELYAREARDAWTRASEVPIGAVWVRRTGSDDVEALSGACPHLGCAIGFDVEAEQFRCPCHKSAFRKDGQRLSGPSRRDLDPLPVEVRDGRVHVSYVRFRPDISEREQV